MCAPGIGFLATYLDRRAIPVKIFDRNAAMYRKKLNLTGCDKAMLKAIGEMRPEFVGFHMMSTHFRDIIHCTSLIIKHFCDIRILLGGVHPTFDPERTMHQIPEADIIVRGPGEYIVEKILSHEELSSIPNLVLRQGSQILYTDKAEMGRTEEIIVDYRKFGLDIYWRDYTEFINAADVFPNPAVLISQQGCPGKCHFCVEDRYPKRGFCHSDDFVLDEMELLSREYDRQSYIFMDRVFRGSRNGIIRFCNQKIKRGLAHIPWGASFRADFIDEQFIRIIKDAGCIFVAAGLEAATQPMLDYLNKGLTVEQLHQAFGLLDKSRILFLGSFIYGIPGQTHRDMEACLDFFKRYMFADSGISQLAPYPGSSLFDELVRRKKIFPDDPKYWDFVMDFDKPVAELNFTELEDDDYIDTFQEHANYIYDACGKNRPQLINEYFPK